jgi:ATP-dependent Lon protease
MATIPSLAIFPLGVVLYPHERLPLHIFEPQYKEMIQTCLEEGVPFGVILFNEGATADIGCTATVVKVVSQYEDGRMDILVEGFQRFRILKMYPENPYMTAEVELIPEPSEAPERDLKERAITQHMKLLELAGRTVRPSLYQDVREVSFVMAHNAGLTLRQKQQVLELPGEKDRIAYLVDHFEELIPRVEQMEGLKRKIQSNGHFKDFPPEEGDGEE